MAKLTGRVSTAYFLNSKVTVSFQHGAFWGGKEGTVLRQAIERTEQDTS